jgi:hypothetical protein
MGAIPRRPPTTEQDRVVLSYDHAELTGDLEVKLLKVPAFCAAFRVDKVEYINPTGLADDATNFFEISVMNGATVVAGPLTTEGVGGAADLDADVFVELDLSATDADTVLAPGDVLSVLFDETAAATLPPGRIVIHGRYI